MLNFYVVCSQIQLWHSDILKILTVEKKTANYTVLNPSQWKSLWRRWTRKRSQWVCSITPGCCKMSCTRCKRVFVRDVLLRNVHRSDLCQTSQHMRWDSNDWTALGLCSTRLQTHAGRHIDSSVLCRLHEKNKSAAIELSTLGTLSGSDTRSCGSIFSLYSEICTGHMSNSGLRSSVTHVKSSGVFLFQLLTPEPGEADCNV